MTSDFSKQCFVCQDKISPENSSINMQVNLPVCESCKGSNTEKETVSNLLEGLADGFVCGCI